MVKGPKASSVEIEQILRTVMEAASPTEEQKEMIENAAEMLIDECQQVLEEFEHENIEPRIVGSVAKGTMMKDPDIDLFLLFSRDSDDVELESIGMEIGARLLSDPVKRYSQHPYLTGVFRGVQCDVVPCRKIDPGDELSTAVDRTPLHTSYINERLAGKARDHVVLLKSFLKGIGSYGAEDTVEGFSGYLAELLVLYYGDLRNVLEMLASISIPGVSPGGCEEIVGSDNGSRLQRILTFDAPDMALDEPDDKDRYREIFKGDVYIVVDPVDSSRNVASPISAGTLSYTGRAARDLLRNPHVGFFHPFSRRPLAPQKTEWIDLSEEGQTFMRIRIPVGDPGAVITQFRRSMRKMRSHLMMEGFEEASIRFLLTFPEGRTPDHSYLKSRACWTGWENDPYIIIGVRTLPDVLAPEYKHWGPPLHNPRIKDFQLKWGKDAKIDDSKCRAYTIRKRETVEPALIMMEFWKDAVHGSLLKDSSLEALSIDDVDESYRQALSGHFDPWNI